MFRILFLIAVIFSMNAVAGVVDDEHSEVVSVPEDQPLPDLGVSVNGEQWVKTLHKNLKSLDASRKNLVQMPMPLRGSNRHEGMCGSFHSNPDTYFNNEPHGNPTAKTRAGIKDIQVVDNYLEPAAACSLGAVIQEWAMYSCRNPKNRGCRFVYGDCSQKDVGRKTENPEVVKMMGRSKQAQQAYKGHKYTWVHQTHNTKCVDIRPVRNTKEFINRPISAPDTDYDREKFKALLRLLKKHGGHGLDGPGSPMLFNDDEIIKDEKEKGLVRQYSGHNAHVHVCFSNKDACKEFEYYPTFCDNLQ